MVIQIVRFKSELSEEKVLEKYKARASRYREVKGLKQKYYLKFTDTGEFGAVYLWETETALKEFRESDLGKTIASTYKVQGDAESQLAELVMVLHEN